MSDKATLTFSSTRDESGERVLLVSWHQDAPGNDSDWTGQMQLTELDASRLRDFIGAWLGLIMLFNVWVLIWPNQKKVLGLVPASDGERNRARRVAFLASRTNVMLSIPMLFFMVASGGMFRTAMF